jgi:uncharacterized protein (DUF2141 family)
MKRGFILIMLFAQLAVAAEKDSSGTIIIEMVNFKNDQGKVRVSLFASKDGFPNDYKKAHAYITETINTERTRVVFEDVPYGEYAIGILHDENMDSKLNTNWLGMPKEGIAASNNAKAMFGPPSFEKASFILNADSLKQEIKIEYF